jgi:RNA polymerase sigma-70 factor (ECF subfamily)
MITNATQFVEMAVRRGDLDLVHATREGDMSAFEQLVLRYDRKLFRIAQNITHNREDSEDAVQESFLKAFQSLDGFREQAQFSTWIYRIVVNVCLMKLRTRNRSKEVALEDDSQNGEGVVPLDVADRAQNPEELFQTSELRNILTKGLQRLSPVFRAVFVLRDVEGLSVADTAEVVGISSSAVKARLFRARARLRQFLSSYFSSQKNSVSSSALSFREVNQFIPCDLNPTQRAVDHQGAL